MRPFFTLFFFLAFSPILFAAGSDIPLPVRKPADGTEAQSEKVEPDTWTEEEIAAAQKNCSRVLNKIALTFEPLEPIKKGRCGTPAPIRLKSIDHIPKIEISPKATLNCQMAAKLNKWFSKVVQPAAQKLLQAKIVKIRNVSSYACRNRYNNPKARISEHAFANALDIASFETAKEENIRVLDYWGLTDWEIASWKEAKEKAEAEAEAAAKAKEEEAKKAEAEAKAKSKKKDPEKVAPDKSSSKKTAQPKSDFELKKLPAPKNPARNKAKIKNGKKSAKKQFPTTIVSIKMPDDVPKDDPRRLFLRRIHKGACGIFGTVLGPEANQAHKNHFHVDLAPRKRSAYCE